MLWNRRFCADSRALGRTPEMGREKDPGRGSGSCSGSLARPLTRERRDLGQLALCAVAHAASSRLRVLFPQPRAARHDAQQILRDRAPHEQH